MNGGSNFNLTKKKAPQNSQKRSIASINLKLESNRQCTYLNESCGSRAALSLSLPPFLSPSSFVFHELSRLPPPYGSFMSASAAESFKGPFSSVAEVFADRGRKC